MVFFNIFVPWKKALSLKTSPELGIFEPGWCSTVCLYHQLKRGMITRITYGPRHERCAIIIICLCVCLLGGFQCLNLMYSNWYWPILTKICFTFLRNVSTMFFLFWAYAIGIQILKKLQKMPKTVLRKNIEKGVKKNLNCTAKDFSLLYPYCIFWEANFFGNISIFYRLWIPVLKIKKFE